MATILLTGASSGIGACAALRLTREGHRVIATGRSEQKLTAVHRAMLDAAAEPGLVPEPIVADLSSLTSVEELASRVRDRGEGVEVLVNNAAVQPSARRLSVDGHELNFAVNHLAHYLLTVRLLPSLSRVVVTASSTHEHGKLDFDDLTMAAKWTSRRAYGRSKLANILFTAELRRRSEVAASSFHPGAITTDLNRDSPFVRLVKPFERFLLAEPDEGADTLVWLATGDEGGAPRAVYYIQRTPHPTAEAAADPAAAARLWDVSATLTGVATP